MDRNDNPLDADLEAIGVVESLLRESLAHRDVQKMEPALSALLAQHELPEDLRVQLGLGMLQANIQATQVGRQRLFGAVEPISLEPEPGEERALSATGIPNPAPSSPLLSKVLQPLLEYMESEQGWRGQTLHQNRTTYRLFGEVCGDRPVQAYTRRDLTTFYDTMRGLPALWSKKRVWSGLSLREIVEGTKGEAVDRLSMKTIKRHFSALGRLFDHLKRRGDFEGENPAHGFQFPLKGRASKKRQMWEGDKLARLFASPVWTGCLSAKRRSNPGDMIIRDERYWLPLLGLYHGNRLEEFAQLRRGDVREENDIWFFDINAEGGNQLKNDQSVRRVPIHAAIIALGFLEYVDSAAPDSQNRLFPNLKPGGPDRKLGFYFTKWWTDYRKDIGVYERGLDYHSFRHGVTTKLYAAGNSAALIDELTGLEGQGTSRMVYKNDIPLAVIQEAINKVDWPEVRLGD